LKKKSFLISIQEKCDGNFIKCDGHYYQCDGNYFSKVPKRKYFALKTKGNDIITKSPIIRLSNVDIAFITEEGFYKVDNYLRNM